MRGILEVMRSLGMLPPMRQQGRAVPEPLFASKTHWSRAPMSGLWQARRRLGEVVEQNSLLGVITDPIGDTTSELRATHAGLLIGCAELPVVNQGDALFHLPLAPRTEEWSAEPLFDEDEIV